MFITRPSLIQPFHFIPFHFIPTPTHSWTAVVTFVGARVVLVAVVVVGWECYHRVLFTDAAVAMFVVTLIKLFGNLLILRLP